MKRFTETLKWEDPWFRRLPTEDKLLWMWLLDHCDAAGIIDPDYELASFQIGFAKGFLTLPDTLSERVEVLPSGKLLITKFIPFQYGTLSPNCKPHTAVFRCLEKHGIKGYPKGINTLEEKETDKDQEEEEETAPKKARGTVEEFQQYAVQIGLRESDGESMFYGLEANGWMRGKNPIKDWKSHMRSWKAQGHHPSQKNGPAKTGNSIADFAAQHRNQ
jgi:hypothetical protein